MNNNLIVLKHSFETINVIVRRSASTKIIVEMTFVEDDKRTTYICLTKEEMRSELAQCEDITNDDFHTIMDKVNTL